MRIRTSQSTDDDESSPENPHDYINTVTKEDLGQDSDSDWLDNEEDQLAHSGDSDSSDGDSQQLGVIVKQSKHLASWLDENPNDDNNSEDDYDFEHNVDWGRDKSNFYGKTNEREPQNEEDMEIEEIDAIHQQQGRLRAMAGVDYSLYDEGDDEDTDDEIVMSGGVDIPAMDKIELGVMLEDLKKKARLIGSLKPFLVQQAKVKSPIHAAVQRLFSFYSFYCSTLCVYMAMRASSAVDSHHPILKMLTTLKSKCKEVDSKSRNLFKLMGRNDKLMVVVSAKKSLTQRNSLNGDGVKEMNKQVVDSEAADNRRAVDYEILKNRGLVPKRKKEMRNPRVRHRNRFKKALVRRRAQVPDVRNKDKPYQGETTGIKSNLRRSVKLK